MNQKGIFKKVLVVLLTLAVLVVVGLLDPSINELGPALARANLLWILAAFLCTLLYYMSDLGMYLVICRRMKTPQGVYDGLITTMIGFFYNALTPFQSGGQPMQVLQMRSRGIPVGSATSTMVVKLLAWQFAAFGMGTVGLAVQQWRILEMGAGTVTLLYVGWFVNLLVLVIALLALLRPEKIRSIGKRLLSFLHRHRIIRKEERYARYVETWERTIGDYGVGTKFLFENKLKTLPIFFFGLLEVVFYMLVTYCIYRAFGLSAESVISIVFLQSVLTVGVSFIPLPGAAIASEGGFYAMFGTVFGSGLRFPSMLLWRLFTYYMNIFLGLVFVVIDGFRKSKGVKRPGVEEG